MAKKQLGALLEGLGGGTSAGDRLQRRTGLSILWGEGPNVALKM